jgi:hypothetical protein
VGLEYRLPVGITEDRHYTFAFTVGYELTRGETLPPDARRRGTLASAILGGVGLALIASAWATVAFLSHVG